MSLSYDQPTELCQCRLPIVWLCRRVSADPDQGMCDSSRDRAQVNGRALLRQLCPLILLILPYMPARGAGTAIRYLLTI